MDFNRAEQEYQRLKALYNRGELTAEAFEAASNENLVVHDRFGCIWQIGVNSGKWYCFENGSWVQKEPNEAVGPTGSSESETPETLQPPKKPVTIFDFDSHSSDFTRSEEPEAVPVPEGKLKSGRQLSPAQIRGSFSWIMLVGVIIFLMIVIGGLGTLLIREQAFGWNPSTPVRFGSPTPIRLPTRTQALPSETSLPTQTAAPTGTPSPTSSRTFTAEPQYAPQVWGQTEAIYFTAQTSLSEAWLTALKSAAAVTFEDYNRLGSMKVLYGEELLVFPSGTATAEPGDYSAVQQEVVFAFPQPKSNVSLTLMCRMQDGKNGYGLRITPFRWKLFKAIDGVETSLAEGTTSLPLQQGNWATMRMGCVDNQLTVWDETGLITTVEDSSLSAGRVAVRFENNSPEPAGEIALYFYRLLQLEK